ncbi:MAG TPA: BamA/TamA family outer membrane protein [Thermoanaerobaculia bacterium]|nr:BamA/TamA family outer membrane protein [Thermoanaerobaculia bacterium]
MARRTVVATALAVWFAIGQAANADTLRTRIEGVRGELRDQLELVLQSERFDGETELTPEQVESRFGAARDGGMQRALEPFGYYQPTVNGRLEREAQRWTAVFSIALGEPVRVRTLDVRILADGEVTAGLGRARDAFPLAPGETFSHILYEQGKAAIEDAAARAGFLEGWFVERGVTVDVEARAADIVLHYSAGRQFHFGEVTIEPPNLLDPRVLRDFVTIRPGEPFGYGPLLAMQRSLLDTGYFAQVEIEALPQLEGPLPPLAVPVRVGLVAARPTRLSLGAGYRTDIGVRGSLDLDLRRLNALGHQFGIELQAAEHESFGKAQLVLPRTSRARTDRLVFDLGYADARPDTSDSKISIGGASYSRTRGSLVEVASLQFRRDDWNIGPPSARSAISGRSDFLLLAVSQTRTARESPVYSREGSRLRLRLEAASEGLLSETDLLRALVDGKWIQPVGRRFRLLYRTDLAHLWAGEFDVLPPNLRFFTGGDQSVRGFGYNELGARNEQGIVIGGDALAVASLELERRIFDRWAVAAFFDAGDAFFADDPPALRDLRMGAGLGARWLSPIGMVRVDVAVAFREPGHPVRFHLTIGPDL